MVTTRRKHSWIGLLFALLLLMCTVGCMRNQQGEETDETESFVEETKKPDETTEISETEPVETEPSETAAVETESAVKIGPRESVKVISNNGGIEFKSIALQSAIDKSLFKYDGRYCVAVTKELENLTFYILDFEEGNLVAEFNLKGLCTPYEAQCTDEGVILYHSERGEGESFTINDAYLVTYANGKWDVSPTSMVSVYPKRTSKIVSPDGKFTVYKTDDDLDGHGGIDILFPDGSIKRVMKHLPYSEYGLQSCAIYIPQCFVDDTRFIYTNTDGIGLYDIASGENRILVDIGTYCGYFDGYVYYEKSKSNATESLWKCDLNGEQTMIASVNGAYGLPTLDNNHVYSFRDGKWFVYHNMSVFGDNPVSSSVQRETVRISIYTSDFREELAVVEIPYDSVWWQRTLVGREDKVISIVFIADYSNVEFTTHVYGDFSIDLYDDIQFIVPSYCYYYNGVFLESGQHASSTSHYIERVLLTGYPHSFDEFEVGTDMRETRLIKVTNPIAVTKDDGEVIKGLYGEADLEGTLTRLYAFYIPNPFGGDAWILYLWERPELDGEGYFGNIIVPIVKSLKLMGQENETERLEPWHIFKYDGVKYDFWEINESVNGVGERGRIGKYVIAQGHINPKTNLYLVINTETKQIEHYFSASTLAYHSDDINTIVYAYFDSICTYDGEVIASSVANSTNGEYISDITFSEDKRQIEVTVVGPPAPHKVTFELPEYNTKTTEYTVEIPLENEREHIEVAAVYGKAPSYSGSPRQNVLYAGEDGVKYYVMGVADEWEYAGNFKTLRTYRVTSKDGYIESVEETETFTKDVILWNGKPYSKTPDGLFSFVGTPLRWGSFGNRQYHYSAYFHADGTMETVIGAVDMGAAVVYEGTYLYDVSTGMLTANLTGRYASNGDIYLYPDIEVKGKLYEYGGFVHFICESSGINSLTEYDAVPLTFVPNTDGYAYPEPIVLYDAFNGSWISNFTDENGEQFCVLSINTQTNDIYFEHGYGDGTVNRFIGTITVNPLTMVSTAKLRPIESSSEDVEFTMKFTLGYSHSSEWGLWLNLDIRSFDAPSYEHFSGKGFGFSSNPSVSKESIQSS